MDATFSLVCLVAILGLFAKFDAAPQAVNTAPQGGSEDTCIVSLVIPKEKIKNSCDHKGISDMKMQSLVSEITQVQQDIGELNVRIAKILSRDTGNEDIKVLNERVLNLEHVKIPNLESRVRALEEGQKHQASFSIPRKRLVKMLKPVLKKEMSLIKRDIAEAVSQEIMRGTTGLNGKEKVGPQAKILFNNINSGRKEKPKSGKNLKNDGKEPSTDTDIKHSRFSKRFNQHLESLTRQFQYESDRSAMDNELPGIYPLQNPFQADGRYDPKLDRLIEIFKNEMTESLDQQTEKVKSITNKHLNEVEGKMSKILNIIEAIQVKYEHKFTEMTAIARARHHTGNSSTNLEHLEQDVKTLAAGIAALRSNFFADPQFQQLFKQELITMENKMSGKFFEHTEPLRQELKYFYEQLDKSKTDQILTKTTFQNYRADLRVQLHYMEQNISSLNHQFAIVNNTLLYPDYQGVDMDDADREMRISKTMSFVDTIRDEWPNVLSNLTHLVEVHVTDVDTIQTDFNDAKQKYDQLKESQKKLIEQITTIENSMDKFKGSLEQVEKFTLSKALEANHWIEHEFEHSGERTSCFGGKMYVRQTGYKTGVFAGVVLCSATRYKIYLSNSLDETFLDVGDADGRGEDHCEFVGGNQTSVINVEKPEHLIMGKLTGYFRHGWGEPPTKGNIKFFWPTPYWYECGVSIPK